MRMPKGQCCCPSITDSLGLCQTQKAPDGAASPAQGPSAALLPFRSQVKGRTTQEGFLRAFSVSP